MALRLSTNLAQAGQGTVDLVATPLWRVSDHNKIDGPPTFAWLRRVRAEPWLQEQLRELVHPPLKQAQRAFNRGRSCHVHTRNFQGLEGKPRAARAQEIQIRFHAPRSS